MSTKKFSCQCFRSRKLLVILCSFIPVVLIALGCGAWMMSREKQIILSVNNNETELRTYAKTLSDLLEGENISLEDVTDSDVDLDAALRNGQRVDVEVTSDFKILVDDDIREIRMAAASVADVLEKAGVVLGENDVVEPDLQEKLFGDTVIDVHRVTVKEEVRETELAYSVETQKDPAIASGDKLILQAGVCGLQRDTYRITYWDGEFYREELISSEVTDPVAEIVAVGSGVSALAVDDPENENGSIASRYSAPQGIRSATTLILKATAYHESEGSLTKSGTLSRVGAVAVDPDVIPLGTKLYVEGYGYCVAEDTGGLIKGNRIDLYFDSEAECIDWGVRDVIVHILE